MKIGDKVRLRWGKHIGVIVKDLGVITPFHSQAPLAESYPPERVWRVEFTFDLKSGGRSFKDQQNRWESDLVLVEQ